MDLDGQAIERRDFPISRRGYEPAAVDAHLRALSAAVSALRSEVTRGETLGESAGSQVQGILDAAQSAAAEIESDAKARAAEELRQAAASAAEIRGDALAKADAHVAAVGEAALALRRRLEAMEGQLGALTSSLQEGSSRLAKDLGGVREEMAALYDAASGRRPGAAAEGAAGVPAAPAPRAELPAQPSEVAVSAETVPAEPVAAERVPAAPVQEEPAAAAPTPSNGAAAERSTDVDGARLIALNMALNGDSREDTDRYLSEHFDLPERAKLVDEVFAAIGS